MGQVQQWLDKAQALGIASIICILDEEHLSLYPDSDLIGLYRTAGFTVCHLSARDHSHCTE